MRQTNILIACEESQTVCTAFRKKGHRAFSCDIQECSGGHPEWHIQGDCLPLLNGNCTFKTADTHTHTQNGPWDMIIAHPPCTYLTIAANRSYDIEKFGDKARERWKLRAEAIEFFMKFTTAECERIAIENPIGIMSTEYRKPSQIIQPFQFGEPKRKATCLWLKNIPLLKPTNIVEPDIYYYKAKNGSIKSDSRWRSQCKLENRGKHRSKFFPGIAEAMAEQWENPPKKDQEQEYEQLRFEI